MAWIAAFWLVCGTVVNAERLSLEEFAGVAKANHSIRSFTLEGVVRAGSPEGTMLILQEDDTALLLELPKSDASWKSGDRLRIEAENVSVGRGGHGTRIAGPVVEIDGRHRSAKRSGTVYLEAGMQPLEIEWFNGRADAELELEYEGPRMPRQAIPPQALWRHGTSPADPRPGLDFTSYTGELWQKIPDFSELKPVSGGVASQPDISLRPRAENVGMKFSGLLKIRESGVYTFHLLSDDGGRVQVGAPGLRIARIGQENALSPAMEFQPHRNRPADSMWVTMEGQVSFVAPAQSGWELEVIENGMPILVWIQGIDADIARNLTHSRVRITGICQSLGIQGREPAARILAIGRENLEILPPLPVSERAGTLTAVGEVRSLQPAEASRGMKVKLRGVVTAATTTALVLQDATGGIYITCEASAWTDQPRVGERWEIEGSTSPGDFAPVVNAVKATCLGHAPLPEPILPTWQQIMSGSVDVEYVEVEGVVLGITDKELTLLTRDGEVVIHEHDLYPLPHSVRQLESRGHLVGSVIRLRGVFIANWDRRTGRVRPGDFNLGNAMMAVSELPPEDPYAVPAIHVADLLLFPTHINALKRVKVAGQILDVRGKECFLSDGEKGIRLFSRNELDARPGDWVEAVGFPRFAGYSLMLMEVRARVTGKGDFLEPRPVDPGELPMPGLDSTRIRLEALLLSDTVLENERVLELQAGPNRFVARLQEASREGNALTRGSRLRLTGVYASQQNGYSGGDFNRFELLVRGPADVTVLEHGNWWTTRHTLQAIGGLSFFLILALAWVLLLRRKISQRTRQLRMEIGERQRVEQSRLMEAERARLADDLHDELGAGLTEVGMLSNLAKNPAIAPERRQSYLEQLSQICHALVTGLDEIVWAVNPRYDSVEGLAEYFSMFAERFLKLAGISCRFDISEAMPEHPLDARCRHGVFLAFKEALHNVVKHSGATEAAVGIRLEGQALRISVRDHGKGFDPGERRPGGDGLQGMKNRLGRLGGNVEIVTKTGEGTFVQFILPLEKKGP